MSVTAPRSDATHEVFNQVPPLENRNLFLDNAPLVEALEREGGGWARERARAVGAAWGADPIAWGFEANEYPPRLKTFDRYGNLQLTFQRRGVTGNDYAVDVDIDDAQGIEHLFQVLRNSVNGPTNPYDIHDILLRQTPPVIAGYDFAFASIAASV